MLLTYKPCGGVVTHYDTCFLTKQLFRKAALGLGLWTFRNRTFKTMNSFTFIQGLWQVQNICFQ